MILLNSMKMNGAMPPGSFLTGNPQGFEELVKEVNTQRYSANSLIGSSNKFVENFVNRAQEMMISLNTNLNLSNLEENKIHDLNSKEDLEFTTQTMKNIIMSHPDVYNAVGNGMFLGYGDEYSFTNPKDNPFTRAMYNGFVDLSSDDVEWEEADDGKEYSVVTYEWHSTDPEFSDEELDKIYRIKDSLDYFMNNTEIDITTPAVKRDKNI